jgi:catecholate siderophore receptor
VTICHCFSGGIIMRSIERNPPIRTVTKLALLSVSYVALAAANPHAVHAEEASPTQQTAPSNESQPPAAPAQQAPTTQPDTAPAPSAAPAQEPSTTSPLQQVTVEPAPSRRRQTSTASAPRPSVRPPSPPPPGTSAPSREAALQAAWPVSGTQDARTGTVGIYSNSTPVATKINTPLVNIPQSLSVVTREFINDTSFQNLTDITRYVPGVAVHQGEGNRDELVIRGVDSSANFFVNGFRDDVQYFRDLYNAQSVEILKGPSAITFGRSAGGGLLNRTLKEADGQRIYEVTGQTGSWYDGRFTLDAGQAVNENVAVRLNAMYERSDSFRQFNWLDRYGVNPTFTFKLGEATKFRLSYRRHRRASIRRLRLLPMATSPRSLEAQL